MATDDTYASFKRSTSTGMTEAGHGWRTRRRPVRAHQYRQNWELPGWLLAGELSDRLFTRGDLLSIRTAPGLQTQVDPGDWLVLDEDGVLACYSDADFLAVHEQYVPGADED